MISCLAFHHVKEKRTIETSTDKPATPVIVQLSSDTSFTCYFNRQEWSDYVSQRTVNREVMSEYFKTIDSIQTKRGYINTDDLPIIPGDSAHLNVLAVTLDIIDSLFIKGHVYVQYQDGSVLQSMQYVRTQNKKVRKEYFTDTKRGKTLLYKTENLRGSF